MGRAGTILFATDVGDHTLLTFTLLVDGGWAILRGEVVLATGTSKKTDVERGTDRYMALLHEARPGFVAAAAVGSAAAGCKL